MAYKSKEKNYWVGEARIRDWTGKIERKKKRGFKTKKEALEWENSIKSQSNPSMEMKFEEFVEIYFRDKEVDLKERSIKNKRYMIDRHLTPYFKGKKMNEITAQDIILWQKEILKNNYSETYQRMVQNQITALFTHASRVYDLKNNPCKKVSKIGKSDIRRLEFWTKDEYDRFIGTIDKGTRYYVIFEVLFYTGCRIGELLALTKDDFDFNSNIMHIRHTYYRVEGRDVITVPKTEQSVRDVVLPGFLADEVKEYINSLYQYPHDARLFPIVQEAVQHKLRDNIVKANVPKIPVHSLRHSASAYLISQGVPPMVIKERLGHKDIKITLNTYDHLYPNEHQQVADLLDKLNQKSSADANQQSKLNDEE